MSRPSIVWFGDDLRLDDQEAVAASVGSDSLFVYVYDEEIGRPYGSASKWWLGRSLAELSKSLEAKGARLDILEGPAKGLIPDLAKAAQAERVFFGRRYGHGATRLAEIEHVLQRSGHGPKTFNTRLMREPSDVTSESGKPFKVYSAFWRRHRALAPLPAAHGAPRSLASAPWPKDAPKRVTIADLKLQPTHPDWSGGLAEAWSPGEKGAQALLHRFLDHALAHYADERDRPDLPSTSRLSPHLRFGEISPRRIAQTVESALAQHSSQGRDVEKFLSELVWREFSYSLLSEAPDLATEAWNPKFAHFGFHRDEAGFKAWTRGETGYPIVDAGMRELWATGYMHNRVRLIVASFLVKHQLIDWRKGETWFWDTLCDADEGNNPANWQWVAGSGADAAPYFRIFNPILQGEKFDPNGDYVKRWAPELERLNPANIHSPWRAPASELTAAGVKLGKTYPGPIVEHDFARRRALDALKATNA